MIPVFQNRFGPVEGNCFAACIASLLELSIEDVSECFPQGSELEDSLNHWHDRIDTFLLRFNLFKFCVKVDLKADDLPFYGFLDDVHCILSGPSPRFSGSNHAVIGSVEWQRVTSDKWRPIFKMVHDPHPEGRGLSDVTMLEFLIPVNPARKYT